MKYLQTHKKLWNGWERAIAFVGWAKFGEYYVVSWISVYIDQLTTHSHSHIPRQDTHTRTHHTHTHANCNIAHTDSLTCDTNVTRIPATVVPANPSALSSPSNAGAACSRNHTKQLPAGFGLTPPSKSVRYACVLVFPLYYKPSVERVVTNIYLDT